MWQIKSARRGPRGSFRSRVMCLSFLRLTSPARDGWLLMSRAFNSYVVDRYKTIGLEEALLGSSEALVVWVLMDQLAQVLGTSL